MKNIILSTDNEKVKNNALCTNSRERIQTITKYSSMFKVRA